MKPLLLLVLSFTSLAALSQPIILTKDFHNEAYHDGYLRKEISFNHQLLSVVYTNKASGYLAAGYYRYNDSSFVYKGFDSAGNIITEGLMQTFKRRDIEPIFQIPDLINDPDGSKGMMKDSIIRDATYLKHGLWKEYDTLSGYWQGNYHINERLGLWKHFKIMPDQVPKEQCDEIFRPWGRNIYTNSSIPLTQQNLFKKIKEKWYKNWLQSSPTIVLLDRGIIEPQKLWYNFISASSYLEVTHNKKQCGIWQYKDGLLILKSQQQVQRYQIEYLDKNDLVLRRIL